MYDIEFDARRGSTRGRRRRKTPTWRRATVDVAGRGSEERVRPTRVVQTSSQCPSALSRRPEVEILSRLRREAR